MRAQRYSNVAVALHWAIAILILGQIAGGLYMHNLPNSAAVKFDLYQLHKSFGLSIFALTLVRLGWRLLHKPPALPNTMPGWQVIAARGTHWLFYFLMLATPLVGLAIVSVSPKDIPTEWFGLFGVPHLGFLDPGADPAATEHQFIELHETLSFAILGLLGLHIAAAVKHGFFNRDGVLRSMKPGGAALLGIAGVFAALGIAIAAYFVGKSGAVTETPEIAPSVAADEVPQPAATTEAEEPVEDVVSDYPAPTPNEIASTEAPASPRLMANAECSGDEKLAINWRVDEAASGLRFIGSQDGRSFDGAFNAFTADIGFDEQFLSQSWFRVTVQTTSAATGDQLIDSTIPGGEWFDVKEFPTATFMACDIQRTGDNAYEAVGALQIKDISKNITLPFQLQIENGKASATGGVDLIRTDFDLGSGSSWLEDEAVALEARVEFSISAEPYVND